MLDVADYMFPRDLQVREFKFRRCLFIGSCLVQDTLLELGPRYPETKFDLMLFNLLSEMKETAPAPVSAYDFQYIQLPLRSIITDSVVRFENFNNPKLNKAITKNAHNALRLMLDQALKYNKRDKILTFVQNFIVPELPAAAGLQAVGTHLDLHVLVQGLNTALVDLLTGYSNVYLVDAEAIASAMGKRYFLDDSIYFFTHGGFSYPGWVEFEGARIEKTPDLELITVSHRLQFMDAILRACEYNYRVIQQIDSVKLVIFDLDDTVWRGLIGEQFEEGTVTPMWEGWPLGVHEAIHHLKARGILVAICSKNSPEIVRKRWAQAVPLQWIKLDDFVAVEISWNAKVESVAKILSAVSLTPRSVLFVDDNPVEREAMRAAFPGIRTIGGNPFETRRILLASPETQVRGLTKESANRDAMMRKQIERENERKSMSREEFLTNLGARVALGRFILPTDERFPRAFELLNKTNQFNTDGKRWTIQEINDFFAGGGQIITFNVFDKFTDYGLVGVILLQPSKIAQFVMSCRVLGLDVEIGVLRYIMRTIRGGGHGGPIEARIVETEANMPSRDVYERAGFSDLGGGRFAFEAPDAPDVTKHLSIDWA
jgi:FkbH-like protein